MPASPSASVFINCPFDKEYQPLLDAIVFCVAACGFVPRCTLELTDAGEVRIENIYRLIARCNHGIHDVLANRSRRATLSPAPVQYAIGARNFSRSETIRRAHIAQALFDHGSRPIPVQTIHFGYWRSGHQGALHEARERNSTCARLSPIRTGQSRHSWRGKDLAGLPAISQRAASHRRRSAAESGAAYFH